MPVQLQENSNNKKLCRMSRTINLLWLIPIVTLVGLLYFQNFITFDMSVLTLYRIYPLLGYQRSGFSQSEDDFEEYVNETRYILDWTTFFGEPMVNAKGWLRGCEDFNCQMISDKSKLNESHAVLFHIRNMDWNNRPAYRSPNQYYVFYLMESPHHSHVDASRADGFFNLTISYRADSDFQAPYGSFRRGNFQDLADVSQNRLVSLASNKTKLVAWFVSNCGTPSRREQYVNELKKYITVDIFGACGKSHCPKTMSCNDMLKFDYKFYLSFENSLCRDYVTEKLFDRIRYYVVPIVLNASLYQDLLPPYSVVSAADFPSAKSLAKYLHYLNRNLTAYMEYFQWRRDYEVLSKYHDCPNQKTCGFCALCAFLHRKRKVKRIKENAHHWWHVSAECDTSLVPRLLNASI